jgi:beta-glucosidase
VATGSTWDRALLRRMGEALGDECRAMDVAVLLGPGINLKRSPLGGRNFEYFSEDPATGTAARLTSCRGRSNHGPFPIIATGKSTEP